MDQNTINENNQSGAHEDVQATIESLRAEIETLKNENRDLKKSQKLYESWYREESDARMELRERVEAFLGMTKFLLKSK